MRTTRGNPLRGVMGGLARRAQSNYVAGPTLSDALEVCERHHRRGMKVALCYWNARADGPEIVTDQCLHVLEALPLRGLDGYLSVKAPALGFDEGRILALAERAREGGARLHFDAMAPDAVERTQRLAESALKTGAQVGFTLPSRWRQSGHDLAWALETGVALRLVKGQWAAPGADCDPAWALLALAGRVDARCPAVAVATHDAPLAVLALERLAGGGARCVELEQLHGMRPIASRVLPLGRARERWYVPFGHGSLPYAIGSSAKGSGGLRTWGRFAGDVLRAKGG